MKLDVLTKLNNKKKMWITPKHLFYFESTQDKIIYSAGIFVHAQLNKTINTLNNFELQRLLTKGIGLENKEIARVIGLAKNGNRIIDDVLEVLNTPRKKYMFILDLACVSMRSTNLSEEELQSISIFSELLKISVIEKDLLYNFVKCSYSFDSNQCIKIFEQMNKLGMKITMSELKYYIPEIAYITKINSDVLKNGSNLQLIDNCEIRESIVVPIGTTLTIANAVIGMYGTIIVDGGTLIIRDSKIENKMDNNESLINVKNFSNIEIYNSYIDCRNMGNAINQGNGNLTIKNSKIYNTTKHSAVRFWGKQIIVEETKFSSCFSLFNGGGILIEEGVGYIKDCSFNDCEAKNGGAICTTDQIMVIRCRFKYCKVIEYGSAIFYNGQAKSNIMDCDYLDCYPEKEEVIQYISGHDELVISDEFNIRISTILEKRVTVTEFGILSIGNVTVYIKHTLNCRGMLKIKNATVIALEFMERDLFNLTRSRGVSVENSVFDGRLKTGIFNSTGTKLLIQNSKFSNTLGGRAIYDTFEPKVINCIFSNCQSGAIYACSGNISKSTFINCREKSGAGISLYGTRGEIADCLFIRCISEYSGGAIDIAAGNNIINCTYEDCRPNNVSR